MAAAAPDHRVVWAAIDPARRAQLTAKADSPGLWHLAGHGAAVLVLGGLIAAGAPGWWLLLLPQGVLLIFLFTLMHEATHRTAFATDWLNRTVARACGLILVLAPEWFRYFHFAHHRFTQDPQRDPELAGPKPETWRGYLLHISGLPVWRSQVAALIRNAAGRCDDGFVPDGAKERVRREARVMLGTYCALALGSVAAGSAVLIWVWLLPLVLGQPVLRLYLLAEHGRCPLVANMFENTRTTLTNRAVRWLAWNMPYHAEHHACPTVPFHKLPMLHAVTRAHLRQTSPGYRSFTRDYVAHLSAD